MAACGLLLIVGVVLLVLVWRRPDPHHVALLELVKMLRHLP
jgi:hypothetical protein